MKTSTPNLLFCVTSGVEGGLEVEERREQGAESLEHTPMVPRTTTRVVRVISKQSNV
jgi:hypothetical protein